MPPIRAYHVSSEPNLHRSVVHRSVCSYENRDGLLYGANVASFTTTLFQGRLPDFSPYPSSEEEGSLGYRYVMEFDPATFYKFKMADTERNGKRQVVYLLLSRRDLEEKRLAKRVRERIPDTEDLDWETNFPNGQPNDYSYMRQYRSHYIGEVFVNVAFWHDVNVNKPVDDDYRVPKDGERFPSNPMEPMALNVWLARLSGEETDSSNEDSSDQASNGSVDDAVDDLAGQMGRTRLQ